MTQLDLDRIIEDDPEKVKSWQRVVMIQCVGSRCPDNPNCSRICCQSAIKNALRLLDLNPDIQVHVLYRDMRTYGFQEDYYREARQRGVSFFRYSEAEKPVVQGDGARVMVTFSDQVLGKPLCIAADCLASSTGLIADDEGTEDLAMVFRLPRTI